MDGTFFSSFFFFRLLRIQDDTCWSVEFRQRMHRSPSPVIDTSAERGWIFRCGAEEMRGILPRKALLLLLLMLLLEMILLQREQTVPATGRDRPGWVLWTRSWSTCGTPIALTPWL